MMFGLVQPPIIKSANIPMSGSWDCSNLDKLILRSNANPLSSFFFFIPRLLDCFPPLAMAPRVGSEHFQCGEEEP